MKRRFQSILGAAVVLALVGAFIMIQRNSIKPDETQAGFLLGSQTKKLFPEIYWDLPVPPGQPSETRTYTAVVSSVVMKMPLEEAAEFYKKYFIAKGANILNPWSEKDSQTFTAKLHDGDTASPDDVKVVLLRAGNNTRVEFSVIP